MRVARVTFRTMRGTRKILKRCARESHLCSKFRVLILSYSQIAH